MSANLARVAREVGLAILFLSSVTYLPAAEPQSRPLSSGWEFRAVNAADRPEVSGWHPAQVPGVVQTDLLAGHLIPDPFYSDNEAGLQWIGLTDWEYRTTFQVDAAALDHQHLDLVFEGLDTFADVFLNEQHVLSSDNMFRQWRIAVKPLLRIGPNTLRIVFHSPITAMIPKVKALPYILPSVSTVNAGNEENIATLPYTRKAAYQYGWDWAPRYVTIGIWKPVRLESWDAVRIENFHIQQVKITPDEAELEAQLEIEASGPQSATATINYESLVSMSGAESTAASVHSSGESNKKGLILRQAVQLDAGRNHVSIPLRVGSPKLWYPAGYGAQERYRFTVTMTTGNTVVAVAQVNTGLRSIELRRVPDEWGKSFVFVVNGISVFAKGANVIPFDSFPSRVTAERHRQILQDARDANMNMVREWGGGIYESDDFYDICDELGLMVWQEFMFGGDMVPGDLPFQENVREEAIDQVKRLRDHPSIVIWCGNNEIEAGWLAWADRISFKESITPPERERVWQDYVVMYHDIIKKVAEQYAKPTPYWPSSPSADFEAPPNSQDNGDMHYWGVWHALEPIENYNLQDPRFMSEFGFQSFPELTTIMSYAPQSEWAIDSMAMMSHQKNHGGNERILTYMLREYPEPKDFPSFVYVSQVQQAEAIKVGAEHLRRNRPRTMGALFWQLNDCWPVASWSSVDYFGRWKALQYYARRFYADLLVSPFAHDGVVDVYVVSDKLQPVTGQLRLRLLTFDGKTLLEKVQQVQLPAQSSAVYISVGEKELLANADPEHVFLAAELTSGGLVVSRNTVFFDRMRNLQLPLKPAIETHITGSGPNYVLTLRSPMLARHVYLSFDGIDTQLSDEYFDLLPGEEIIVQVTSSANLQQLQQSLKIMSMTDAFFDQRPTYREHTVIGADGVSIRDVTSH